MGEQGTLAFSRRELTLLKGVGILLVLLGHMQHIIWGGAAGVALFLIASGYGIHESFCENGTKGYWAKRIKKVYIPYFLVALINVLAHFPWGKKMCLMTLFGLDFGMNLDSTMWYISYIFLWYAAFYILSVTICRIKNYPIIRYALEAAALFAVGRLSMRLHANAFNVYACSFVYYCFFPIGVCISMLKRAGAKYLNKVQKPFWIGVMILCAAYQLKTYGGMYTTKTTLTMAFLLIAAGKLVSLPRKVEEGLLWLGKYSYGIYLVEGLIMAGKTTWFAALELTFFMDLAFISASIVVGYFFWNGIYRNVMELLFEKKSERQSQSFS